MFSKIFGTSQEPKPLIPLYQMQNDRMVFNIHKLNSPQCEIANDTCRSEARYQRLQAVAKGAAAVLGAVAIVIAALVLAKIAAPFFALCVAKGAVLANVQLHEMTPFVVKGLTKASIYVGGACGLKKLWNEAYSAVQNHLDYAANLDHQAIKARLHWGAQVLIKK